MTPRKIHELKTWPKYFTDVHTGVKTFDVRRNDRGFAVGDYLKLMEYLPDEEEYTERYLMREIGYILCGGQFGIEDGFCVLGFKRLG